MTAPAIVALGAIAVMVAVIGVLFWRAGYSNLGPPPRPRPQPRPLPRYVTQFAVHEVATGELADCLTVLTRENYRHEAPIVCGWEGGKARRVTHWLVIAARDVEAGGDDPE